jgi:hypothetical protein
MGSYSAVGPHFLSNLLSDSAAGPQILSDLLSYSAVGPQFFIRLASDRTEKCHFATQTLHHGVTAAGMERAATKEPVCRPGRRKRSGPLNSPIGRPKWDVLLKLDLHPKVDEAGGKGVGDGVLDVVYVFDPGVGNDVFGPDEV